METALVLFETTNDPSLRWVYAVIDHAAYQALAEIAELSMRAYSEIWARGACEKPAFLRSWKHHAEVQQQIERFFGGFLRYRADWRYADDGFEYRYEVLELPVDSLLIALRCEGGNRDGQATVPLYFSALRAATDWVDDAAFKRPDRQFNMA